MIIPMHSHEIAVRNYINDGSVIAERDHSIARLGRHQLKWRYTPPRVRDGGFRHGLNEHKRNVGRWR